MNESDMKEKKGLPLSDAWKQAFLKPFYYLIESAAQEHSNREALAIEGERFTYKEYFMKIKAVARGLYAIGVRPGDRIAIWMGNRVEWPVFRFAANKLGASIVPINTRFGSEDVKYVVEQSDARVLVLEKNFLGKIDAVKMIQELCPEMKEFPPIGLQLDNFPLLRSVICVDEEKIPGCLSIEEMLQLGDKVSEEEISIPLRPQDTIHIVYTSGTTGFSKGVMTPSSISVGKYIFFAELSNIEPGDRYLLTVPFFGNMGLTVQAVCVMRGATLIGVKQWRPETVMALIQKEKIKQTIFVPTMLFDIFSHPDFPKYDLRSLKYVMVGGSAVPAKLIKDTQQKIGCEVLNSYGLVEGSGLSSVVPAGDTEDHIVNTVGLPLPYCEVAILDPVTGERLPPNQEGEICTRETLPGSQHMKGYYKQPKLTAEAIRDGWLHSGDLGFIRDDGYLVITGRIKEQFHVGGFNVSPPEIEEFLLHHPKIERVSVVGVPDERLGEIGAAFVRLKGGETATPEEIIDFCRGKIANIKVPKYVLFVEDFPMTPVGKIQKFKLREQFIKTHGASSSP